MRLIDADKLNRKKKYQFQTQGGCFPKSEWFIKADDLFAAPTINPYEWISVEDGLPRMDEEVIVAICDDTGDTPWRYTTVGWMANDTIWIIDNAVGYGITHWMPLPAPPAVKEKRYER